MAGVIRFEEPEDDGGDGGNRDWLMEVDCSGYDFREGPPVLIPLPISDFSETGGLVLGASIAKEVFVDRIREAGLAGRDFAGELSLYDVQQEMERLRLVVASELAETEGCGTMARDPEDVAGAGEFSGVRGIKGRPLTMDTQPMSSDHAARERHRAAFATNPADPLSGEAQGDTALS